MSDETADNAGELRDRLRDVVAESLGDPRVEVEGLHRLTGGASRETWAFDAALAHGGSRGMVLRRDPPSGARMEGRMSLEAAAIGAAARRGVPEPEVLAHGDDGARVGAPFVLMSRVDGETVPRRILRDREYAGVRPRLAQQCGEILARIHSIPAGEVDGLCTPDPLAALREDLDSFADRSPAFELAMRRLERTRPDAAARTVVHGDFRNGNLIVGPDGIRAVLDWELAHLGDPMEDLGWLCCRCWRFGVVGRPVGGLGDYADLFRGYERVAGTPVHPEVVRWWELFGCLRWGALCLIQAWRHLSGRDPSIELAAVGRRVWEQEYDTLLHLREMEEEG